MKSCAGGDRCRVPKPDAHRDTERKQKPPQLGAEARAVTSITHVLLREAVALRPGDSVTSGHTYLQSRTQKEHARQSGLTRRVIIVSPPSHLCQRCHVACDSARPAGRRAEVSLQAHILETSGPGVLAVGDVRSGSVKRAACAVGEGAMAVRLIH
jgi:thioredoxin reductase